MPVVMVMVADALDPSPSFTGPKLYLRDFDPDAEGGRGRIDTTRDLARAQRFPDLGAAFSCWKAQSTVLPLRPDGKPNRPLTAWTVTFDTVPE